MRDTLRDLQSLVETLQSNGNTIGERLETIVAKFQAAPPEMKGAVLEAVEFLSEEIPTLNAALRLADRFDRNGRK